MTNETISLNQKLRKLLMQVEEGSIGRKQLIELAGNQFNLSKIQAQRLVARNIHALTTKDLIVATGKINARVYQITPELRAILQSNEYEITTKTHDEKDASSNELITEETKTSTELKMLLGEIQAYQDYLNQFPRQNKTILSLLNKTRDHATDLYGRLSAIKKIIKASDIEDNIRC
jgi:hypothetical protein